MIVLLLFVGRFVLCDWHWRQLWLLWFSDNWRKKLVKVTRGRQLKLLLKLWF